MQLSALVSLLASTKSERLPPPIGEVLVHHLTQHIEAIFGNCHAGKPTVFYLGIEGVIVKAEGAAASNGRGMFVGPLKSGTSREKDILVSTLQGMHPNFRAQLDQTGIEVIIAAKVIEANGKSHSVGIELREADLAELRR